MMNTVRHSESSLLDSPGIVPPRSVTSACYDPAPRSPHIFDTDYRKQMLFAPNSSTPKHLLGKKTPHGTSILPRTSISLQSPDVCDFGQEKMIRSKSFSTARARLLPETSASWDLHHLADHEERTMPSTCKQLPMISYSLMGQVRKMSSFQADYWACAIPDSLPPSPDRQSPHWNPNKEYEDLLDYTYPLRPKYKLVKNSKDSPIHDSGIELDSFSISPESTLKSVGMQDQEHQVLATQSTQRFLTPLLKKLENPALGSHDNLSPFGKVSFVDGGPSTDRSGIFHEKAHSLSPRCCGPAPATSANLHGREWNTRGHDSLNRIDATHSSFIRSTRVLPLQKECSSDEEYLSLPPRLKELETLALQLTDLSLNMRKPEHDSAEGSFPCISVNGKQLSSEVQADGGSNESQWELYCDSPCSFQEHGEEDLPSNQSWKGPENVLRKTASSDLVEIGCPEFLNSRSHQVKQEKDGDSLAHRIKKFCDQLEELICWLHKVAEVTDNWILPKPDVESVKASLQNYLEFKQDLAEHEALTEGVLQDGERLLKCMTSNSPVLQDTLCLIEKQSDELESHAERLYEAVLAAVDALGAGLVKNCDAQQIVEQSESSK
ncbi:centrosomal protein of 68 kDa isoform X2 [Sceloporus undulatus]|uniref:centrosomal protein of 68 kDa isoform X2 n=1 Tax=Sceloporus undulatus TaxID=8520 RepID=UPI001C4A8791|nr:centrosomal protein of 68 kDa isoform X2 [Sceloporus undulatus]